MVRTYHKSNHDIPGVHHSQSSQPTSPFLIPRDDPSYPRKSTNVIPWYLTAPRTNHGAATHRVPTGHSCKSRDVESQWLWWLQRPFGPASISTTFSTNILCTSRATCSIDLWMAGYWTLPRIVGRFDPRRVFITSITAFVPIYLMLPFENLTLLRSGSGVSALWVLIILQLESMSISNMGFSTYSSNFYLLHEPY
jgi:hypothetical protein